MSIRIIRDPIVDMLRYFLSRSCQSKDIYVHPDDQIISPIQWLQGPCAWHTVASNQISPFDYITEPRSKIELFFSETVDCLRKVRRERGDRTSYGWGGTESAWKAIYRMCLESPLVSDLEDFDFLDFEAR
jgi:hypothetical protein